MEQYGHKTHVGQFLVVFYTCTALRQHQVAAEETELGMLVHLFQRPHQSAGMEVAAGLTYYQIIFHAFSVFLIQVKEITWYFYSSIVTYILKLRSQS